MSLNTLPNELIEYIAIDLNYIDLNNLSQVNQRLNSYLSNYNGLWQQSFRNQWPTLYVEVFESMDSQSEINWRFETIQCHSICVKIYKELCEMSARYHQKDELSDLCFDYFRKLTTEDQHYCVIDQLENIVNSVNEMKYDLTIKFYAQKVLQSLRTEFVRKKWTKMVQELNYTRLGAQIPSVDVLQSAEHDIPGDLISGSVLIAQYCQPNKTISEMEIRRKIRTIALQAVKVLQEKFSTNYLLTQRNGELLTQFEASHLTESISEPKDCIEVIHAINVVMYEGSSRFGGNRDNYYLPTNSYIDKVLALKLGIPILLCVIYQAIAALLGVKLFSISHPGHFLLAIRDKLHIPEINQQFTYIDPFDDGKLITDETVDEFDFSLRAIPSRPLSVFMRMAMNLIGIGRRDIRNSKGLHIIRIGAELANLIHEEDVQMQFMLAQVYLAMDINIEQIVQISDRLERQVGISGLFVEEINMKRTLVKPPPVVKYRANTPGVQFAVGMVMRDLKFNVNCVIYGWDEKCTKSSEWIEQLRETYNVDAENQAFYSVLSEDGLARYTPQEHFSIESETNSVTEHTFHPQIGRYFTRFNGRNYELNEQMQTAYPDDERALNEIYEKYLK